MLFLIVMAGLLFSRFLLISGFIGELKTFVMSVELTAAMFIAMVLVLFLVLGCFVDSVSLMVITLPFLYPISKALGIDGIWFGVLVIKLIEIAAITPPVGLNLFAALSAARGELTSRELFKGVVPFLVMEAVILALLVAFPSIATQLPAWMD
jgi:TRAP-type C4-dicarboxylate transport system permease large subunit